MIFDSHCHPQFPQYDKDLEEMLKRARDMGVFMICVGTDLETSKQGIKLAKQNENMWATVGLHPNDNIGEKFNADEYEELLKADKVVGMGEIGLDYYRTTNPKDQDFQKKRFEEQLDLAVRVGVLVILHSRDAAKGSSGKVHKDMYEMVRDFDPPKKGVAHSFTGSSEDAKKYLELGFYLGFNGILTFTRQYDETVKYVPLESILLETDAPFLAPEPHRGKRNEPAYVIEVARRVAELKNESLERVIEKTTKNCENLFNVKI